LGPLQVCPYEVFSSRITLVLERVSPALVTYTAGLSTMGQTFSQAPQPIQSEGSTCGFCTLIVSILACSPFATYLSSRLGTSVSSAQMALGEVGQNSSQTMQGVAMDHGKQRPLSYIAVPMEMGFWPNPILAFSSIF